MLPKRSHLISSLCLSLSIPLMLSGIMLVGCDADGGGLASNLASRQKAARCQESCDQQRFFDCYDASLHAGCYDDCASADSASIDKFVGCVENTICDAECSVHIQGRAAQVPPEERVDTGLTPTQNSSNCESACSAMVADMCVPDQCSAFCSDAEYAFQIVYCNNVRQGCDFPAECTGEVSPVDACKAGCQQMQFFDCLDATDAITCNQTCNTVTDEARNLFANCVDASGTCDAACYTALDPSAELIDTEGCQDSCNNLSFFECIDSIQLAECRQLCTSATSDSIETFKSCTLGVCDDSSCYDTFQALNP